MRSLQENALRQQFDSERERKNAQSQVEVATSATIVYQQATGNRIVNFSFDSLHEKKKNDEIS